MHGLLQALKQFIDKVVFFDELKENLDVAQVDIFHINDNFVHHVWHTFSIVYFLADVGEGFGWVRRGVELICEYWEHFSY